MSTAAGMFKIFKDVLLLTEEVKRLNANTEKLTEKLETVDKRLVRLETMVEMAQMQNQHKGIENKP